MINTARSQKQKAPFDLEKHASRAVHLSKSRNIGSSCMQEKGVLMSKRILSTAAALMGLFAISATGVEARTYQGQGTEAGTSANRPSLSKNFTAKSKKQYASKSKGKRYGSKKSYSKKRSAYGKKGMKNRSLTKYASGGTSRSCLQPQARALLNRIESQFGQVSIVSTCRPGAVIATSGKPSKHRYGLAIDFNAGNRKGAIVNWLIKNHHSGGTMTYRGMNHIHVDIGPRFVSLGANSGRKG
jgi:uncharacterized protein YcbK (DUF882 family)